MKIIVLCAAALGLFVSTPLSAQNNDHRGNQHNAASSNHGAAPNQNRHAPGRSGAAMTRQNGPGHAANNAHANPAAARPAMGRTPAGKPGSMGRTTPRQNRPEANRFLPASGDVHRGQSSAANRQSSSLNSLRRNTQATRRFHGGNYRAPQGYQARHWSHGERLPRGYFAQNYWISNFVMYGLFAPPANLVWVRVGNDALLIDRDSGEIVQVQYGVFY